MDPIWLLRNIRTAWRRRAGRTDFIRDLAWTYGRKLGLEGREFTLGFRYPAPVGEIHLRLRANRGADAFIQGEVFEHEYYRLPLKADPETILDLGANIGLTAVYFGRQFPSASIACVEPFSGNVRLLGQNLRMNGINAQIFAAAIDVEDGQAVMELDKNDYGHRITRGNSGGTGLAVAAISVPTLMKEMGWDRIGLLKADIEGHEKTLFSRECDWLAQVDALCIEWHDEESEARRQLTAMAERFGFGAPQLLPGIWFMSRAITQGSNHLGRSPAKGDEITGAN